MVILFRDMSLEDKTVYLDIFGRYVAFNMAKIKTLRLLSQRLKDSQVVDQSGITPGSLSSLFSLNLGEVLLSQ